MASLITAFKRKLAVLTSYIIPYHTSPTNDEIEGPRPTKRQRLNGAATPMLRYDSGTEESPNLILESLEGLSSSGGVVITQQKNDGVVRNSDETSDLLRLLPPHVLSKCLAYIGTRSDRFGLQTSCTMFRKLSNLNHMLLDVDLGGDWTGFVVQSHVVDEEDAVVLAHNDAAAVRNNAVDRDGDESDDNEGEDMEDRYVLQTLSGGQCIPSGILTDDDTSISACEKLIKFSVAGNMQATYMLAMILCYCLENVSEGLSLLRFTASHGDLRSMYSLALILRDSRPAESNHCLALAAKYGYIPAWQEKLSPTEMRARFGDLDASKLSKYLDPPCLNRLLGRHYLECKRVRKHQTSHCWNPLCGKWAYKATSSLRVERHMRLMREGHEANPASSGADTSSGGSEGSFSIQSMLPQLPRESVYQNHATSPLGKIKRTLQYQCYSIEGGMKVSRMKMCSSCRRAKYCSKLCQVYDWRSGRHKSECPYLQI